ncbi:MAG: pantoate--beta-alanine ligase, partial [Alphaproteobacteria bacterium]
LVERMRVEADRTVVSIFVNPLQFGPDEDYEAYPRCEAQDVALLREAGVDLVYAPAVETMYPAGFATRVRVGDIGERLEGVHRPGHFEGVATVVAKLFLQSRADLAIFGEKDYQQLALIRRMAADLDLPLRILALPIAREPDGLAASSRNAYLTPDERRVAPTLYRLLCELARRAVAGEALPALEAEGRARLLEAGFAPVDYVSFCDAATLAPLTSLMAPARLLAAARLGRARLIDNVAVIPNQAGMR